MKVLIKSKLSEHRSKTPEGYLICEDCPIARTGIQEYYESELFPETGDPNKIVRVDRKPKEVFSEATIASFENKPLTCEHPDENVNPENYRDLSVGFIRDVRKGKFNGQDVMLANIIVTDPRCIEDIENNFRTDLSCGYDCDITDGPNPEQINIRGNHVALCEVGRAGIAKIIDSASVDVSSYIDNWITKLNELHSKSNDNTHFVPSVGKKYIKIIQNSYGSESVFAFVDAETGDIYKPASWSAPAKGIRGNVKNQNLPMTIGALYRDTLVKNHQNSDESKYVKIPKGKYYEVMGFWPKDDSYLVCEVVLETEKAYQVCVVPSKEWVHNFGWTRTSQEFVWVPKSLCQVVDPYGNLITDAKERYEYVIYKSNNNWLGTTYENYVSRIANAFKIINFTESGFKTVEQIKKYLIKYCEVSNEDVIMVVNE